MQELAADTIHIFDSDSVMSDAASDTIEVVVVEPPVTSLFQGHQLQDSHGLTYNERMDIGTGFSFVVMLTCAAVIVFIQRSSDGILSSVFRACFDNNLAQQNARTENSQQARNLFILQVTGVISISLFVAGVWQRIGNAENSVSRLFFLVIGGLIGFVLVKRFIIWLLAFVFQLSSELRTHRYDSNILLSAAGICLLPLSLLLWYGPAIPFQVVMYLGIGIGGLFYLKGLQRGLLLALGSPSVSPLHLFYYLCALEILPVFVLIKSVHNM